MGRSETYVVSPANRKDKFGKRLGKFIFNKDKKSFCGRTCSSWGLIIIYYLAFYGFLAGLCSGCWFAAFYMVSPDRPTYYYEHGNAISTAPGMSFLPQDVESAHMKEVQTLSFTPSEPATYAGYVLQLRNYLTNLYPNTSNHFATKCDETVQTDPCDVSLSQFEPGCWDSLDPDNFQFGFDTGKPCILLRVNKLYNWVPVEFTSSPSDANLGSRWEPGRIPLACETFTLRTGDPKYSLGDIDYFPSGGLPASCFPYCNKVPFYPPVTLVKFHNLTVGADVTIKCHFYATNVIISRKQGTGSASFQINVGS